MKRESGYRIAIIVLAIGFLSGQLSHAADKKAAVKKTAVKKKTAKKKAPAAKVTFDDHVKPIFRAKCFACHNGNKKSGGLDLTNYTNLMLGGSSGDVVERGSATDSYLFSLITHESQPFMPPKSEKMAKASIDTIRKWIDGGALENSGSKPVIAKKKFSLALKSAPSGKPAGPPPMPGLLSRQPVLRAARATAISALTTSPWAHLAAVAGQKQVFLYNTKTLELIGVLPFPEGNPNVLKFSRNGGLLLAAGGRGGATGRAVVWNVKTGKRVIEVGDELDAVLAADISSDHRFIALGGPHKLIQIYSTETGKLLHSIKKHTEWIYSIEFSPDGVLLASSDRNGGLFVWEAETAREYLNLKGHGAAVTTLSWRGDSNILASGSTDASIKLWEMENGRQVKSWGAHGGGVESIEFTRDSRIVSCGRDRITKIWDANGKAIRSLPAFTDYALRVTHCDESNRVISGDWTGSIRVWNAADGKQAGVLSSNPASLDDRIKAAKKTLSALEASRVSLVAKYTQSNAAIQKLQVTLAAAKKTLADHQKLLATSTANMKAAQTALPKIAASILAEGKTITQLNAVIKLLSESVAKAEAAGKLTPADKSLAAAIVGLKTQLTDKSTSLTAAKKNLTKNQITDATTKSNLAAAQLQIKTSQAILATAQKQIAALPVAIKPAVVAAAKAKQAADAATQAASAASEIMKMLQLAQKMETALKVIPALQTDYDKLSANATAVQAVLKTREAELAKANAAKAVLDKQFIAVQTANKTSEAAYTAANTRQTQVVYSVKIISAAVPSLKAAITAAQQSVTKSASDKELAAAVKQLQSVLTRKTAELAALQKEAAAKTTPLALLKKDRDASKANLDAHSVKLKTAQQQVTASTATFQAATKTAASAQSAAKAAQAKLQAAKSQIQALEKEAAPSATASRK